MECIPRLSITSWTGAYTERTLRTSSPSSGCFWPQLTILSRLRQRPAIRKAHWQPGFGQNDRTSPRSPLPLIFLSATALEKTSSTSLIAEVPGKMTRWYLLATFGKIPDPAPTGKRLSGIRRSGSSLKPTRRDCCSFASNRRANILESGYNPLILRTDGQSNILYSGRASGRLFRHYSLQQTAVQKTQNKVLYGREATSGPEGPKGLISGKQPINLL